jgi:hypothetical protein
VLRRWRRRGVAVFAASLCVCFKCCACDQRKISSVT